MPSSETTVKNQLQLASKLSGANWLVWLTYPDQTTTGWQQDVSYGLSPKKKKLLANFLSIPAQANWLSGALASGRTRWQECSAAFDLNCDRVYLFPNPGAHSVLAVGVGKLDNTGENILKLLAFSPPAEQSQKTTEKQAQALAPKIQNEIPWLKNIAKILFQIISEEPIERIFHQITITGLVISGASRVHLVIAPPENLDYAKTIVTNTCIAEAAFPDLKIQMQSPDDILDHQLIQANLGEFKQSFSIPSVQVSPDSCIGTLEFFQPSQNETNLLNNLDAIHLLADITAIAAHNHFINWKLAQAQETEQITHGRLLQSMHLAARGQISAQIANNLNNPLTSIILSLEMMNQNSAEYQRYLPSDTATSLINHLSLSLEQSLRTRDIVWELLSSARDTRPLNQAVSIVSSEQKGH